MPNFHDTTVHRMGNSAVIDLRPIPGCVPHIAVSCPPVEVRTETHVAKLIELANLAGNEFAARILGSPHNILFLVVTCEHNCH